MSIPVALPLEEIASRVTTLSDADAVFVAGSQSLGLAHANSDYDVYVVTDAPIPAAMEYGSKTYYEHTLIDVSYVPAATVERFAEVLRTSDRLSPPELVPDELELMWRMVIGTPISNEGACSRLRESLGLQRVADLIGRWRAFNAEVGYLNGSFLAAHGSDLAAAVALRESAVETACAAITEAGFAYFDTKYLYDQISMAGPRYAGLLSDLWEIESLPLGGTGVAEIESRCQKLGQQWVGVVFGGPGARLAWTRATLDTGRGHSLELAGKGAVVWNRSVTFALEAEVARVWAAVAESAGASVAEISDVVGLPLERCGEVLHGLFVEGLVRLDWRAVISGERGAAS